jgi:hypothetical protein
MLQPLGEITSRAVGSTPGEVADLDPASACPHLLKVTDPALFAPGLVMALRNAVERFSLILAEPLVYEGARLRRRCSSSRSWRRYGSSGRPR